MGHETPGKISVAYIAGAGRSGSTLLDVVLGALANVESVGELCNLHRRSWVQDEVCACGQSVRACKFWSRVWALWASECGLPEPVSYAELQRRFERPRAWPHVMAARFGLDRSFFAYANATTALYRAIATVSGCQVIVDSSKDPVRAYALALNPHIDLRLIHLVRDGRGVAWSMQKSYKKDKGAGIERDIAPTAPWRTILDWALVNVQVEQVARRIGRDNTVRVRYENFVSKPVDVLAEIGNLLACDTSRLAQAVAAGEAIPIGHTVSGNRLRMENSVRLEPDTRWMKEMGSSDQRLCWLLGGWALRRYGYRRNSSPR